jgi:hypothetical protein
MLLYSNKWLLIIEYNTVYIRFPIIFRAINLCAALMIWKCSVLALDEIEGGHAWLVC